MKFDESSHRRVVRDLQRHFHVDLRKIGRARNYLVDGNGVRYIVLGGEDYEHGISRTIFDEEARAGADTLLVVVVTGREMFDIFVGPFRPLLEKRDLLPVSEDRYAFHVHRLPGGLIVREIPSLELRRIDRDVAGATRKPLPRPATKLASRPARSVIAVEGNLVRADFRGKKSR